MIDFTQTKDCITLGHSPRVYKRMHHSKIYTKHTACDLGWIQCRAETPTMTSTDKFTLRWRCCSYRVQWRYPSVMNLTRRNSGSGADGVVGLLQFLRYSTHSHVHPATPSEVMLTSWPGLLPVGPGLIKRTGQRPDMVILPVSIVVFPL